MKQNIKKRTSSAFTIAELLIVIVIIGVLATITVVAYNGVQQNAKQAALISDLDNSAAIMAHDINTNGAYAASVTAADGGRGLPTNSGTTYQYTYDNTASPPTFCLTGTNGSASYYINSTSSAPINGSCSGACPNGFIAVPGSATYGTSNFCVMKYEAKQSSGTVPISQPSGTPWVNISQTNAIAYAPNVAGCTGCHLMTEAEWLTVAQNVLSVASNWSGGSVGSGYIYSGHSDNAPGNALAANIDDTNGYSGETNKGGNQRRTLTLSNGSVIWDFAGDVWEWTSGQISGGQPGIAGGGPAWREWNTLTTQGTLSPNPYPSYALSAAGGWTSGNGIGAIYSDAANSASIGQLHGGSWMDGWGTGIFSLALNTAPSLSGINLGFRVSK